MNIKSAAIAAAATGVLLAMGAAPASAGSDNGNAYGKNGCQIKNGTEFKNPGKMLQYLSERDGNPKATVDEYPNSFDSVGDLISQKCG